MNRPLVLSHEAARHPFRQRLPRHIFAVDQRPRHEPLGDRQLFVMTLCAAFLAFYGFLA